MVGEGGKHVNVQYTNLLTPFSRITRNGATFESISCEGNVILKIQNEWNNTLYKVERPMDN